MIPLPNTRLPRPFFFYSRQVGGLPDTMHLKLIEPLRELFKVRTTFPVRVASVSLVGCISNLGRWFQFARTISANIGTKYFIFET